jgi:predicted nuclease of predicted toxin-antitoxin system
MSVGIYMDVQIPSAISIGLRIRGVDVITAQEDGTTRLADPDLLTRATKLKRLLYTHDDDFLKEARVRIAKNELFCGIIFSRQLYSPTGRCIDDIELIAKTFNNEDMINRIEFIPF